MVIAQASCVRPRSLNERVKESHAPKQRWIPTLLSRRPRWVEEHLSTSRTSERGLSHPRAGRWFCHCWWKCHLYRGRANVLKVFGEPFRSVKTEPPRRSHRPRVLTVSVCPRRGSSFRHSSLLARAGPPAAEHRELITGSRWHGDSLTQPTPSDTTATVCWKTTLFCHKPVNFKS